MLTSLLDVHTGDGEVVMDVTAECASYVCDLGDGLLHVFVPHATAGVAILETGAGSDEDLLASLRDLLPTDDRWIHRHGSRGHGRSHVLPAFIAPFASIPVIDGRWHSVPGRASAWSISMSTTSIDRSGSVFFPRDRAR